LQASLDPKEFQDLLDELKASRASRKTAWDILQELRSILNEHGVVLAPPAAKNIGGRSFQECASHFIPRRQQSPSDTATKQKRNKKDGFGVLLFEGGSADLPLDWQVRISLDHVQMGGPSRFFPVGTPARRVRKLLLI
jgi:hypothetical protein